MKKKIFLPISMFFCFLSVFAQNWEDKRITCIVNGDTISTQEFSQIDTALIESISISKVNAPGTPLIHSIANIYSTIEAKTKPIQSIKGKIELADRNTNNKPAYAALVRNKTTGKWVISNETGEYEIPASNKDSIEYSFTGYHTQTITTKSPVRHIILQKDSLQSSSRANVILVIDKEAYPHTPPHFPLDLKAEDIEKTEVARMFPPGWKWGDSSYFPAFIYVTTKQGLPSYDAIVPDAGFNTFLYSQPPKEFYSERSLKEKNRISVNLWNARCQTPQTYDSTIYESTIDYDHRNKYGLEVEYTLYMFFRFMEMKHNIKI